MLIHSAKELGLYVQNHRKEMKISQSEAGASVGLKQSTLSSFENKAEGTKLETLFRILAATNLEIHIVPKGQNTLDEKNKWDEQW